MEERHLVIDGIIALIAGKYTDAQDSGGSAEMIGGRVR
jgi:hypothetical protein